MPIMPSALTLKKSFRRALWAGAAGAMVAFVATPVNLKEPKSYLTILFFSVLTGFLMGVQKFVSGYLKYDR